MVQRNEAVRFAAAEAGFRLDDWVSTRATNPLDRVEQERAKPRRHVGLCEEADRVAVLIGSAAIMHLLEVGGELRLGVRTLHNVMAWPDNFTPRLETCRSTTLLRRPITGRFRLLRRRWRIGCVWSDQPVAHLFDLCLVCGHANHIQYIRYQEQLRAYILTVQVLRAGMRHLVPPVFYEPQFVREGLVSVQAGLERVPVPADDIGKVVDIYGRFEVASASHAGSWRTDPAWLEEGIGAPLPPVSLLAASSTRAR